MVCSLPLPSWLCTVKSRNRLAHHVPSPPARSATNRVWWGPKEMPVIQCSDLHLRCPYLSGLDTQGRHPPPLNTLHHKTRHGGVEWATGFAMATIRYAVGWEAQGGGLLIPQPPPKPPWHTRRYVRGPPTTRYWQASTKGWQGTPPRV
jgi:hypothetical protein